jgi:cation transport ATPase
VRITRHLGTDPLPVAGYNEVPGQGIAGEIAGHRVLLGSLEWLQQQGVKLQRRSPTGFNLTPGTPEPTVHGKSYGVRWQAQRDTALEGNHQPRMKASSPLRSAGALQRTHDHRPIAVQGRSEDASSGGGVQVAIDGQWRGGFALENSLRPEVAELLAQLGGRFELALLSGDNGREAGQFQKLFGPRARLRFNQRPADKLNFIRELQQAGRRVMMVGDGLNDAGALKQADVGVAVVEQIGVFSPASDVILDAAQLPQLARVLRFARASARVVRAGFLISALYNLAGISVAAAGLMAPMVCAILMPISSATVVMFSCGATAWLGARILQTPERRSVTGLNLAPGQSRSETGAPGRSMDAPPVLSVSSTLEAA